MDSTWHFWSVTGVTGRVNIDALQRLSRRLTTWQKRQWDIHWKHGEQSVHVQLSVAGNEYLYMKRSEHGCALFLPCHCNPLKKLKLLEMSQSKFVWAKKSPALHITCHIIYIWKYNGQVGFRIHQNFQFISIIGVSQFSKCTIRFKLFPAQFTFSNSPSKR